MKNKNEKRVVNIPKEDFDKIKEYCDKNCINMTKWLVNLGITKITDNDLKTQVYQAIGEASMCWHPRPAGVFDSTAASKIGDRLYNLIVNKE